MNHKNEAIEMEIYVHSGRVSCTGGKKKKQIVHIAD